MRYVLMAWLMRAGSVADIEALLAAYDEGTTAWTFARALHAYRTQGPTPKATKLLRAALGSNAHVAPMIIGTTPIPNRLPDAYTMGGADEAALYVHSSGSTWDETMGAIEWMAAVQRHRSG